MAKKCGKYGKLMSHGVRLYDHEKMTIEYFLARGEDIELIVPSNTMKNKNPDWLMRGKIWETKSPQTTNANTLIKRLKCASKQSENLIVDLRRIKGDDKKAIKIIRSKFELSRVLKQLLIIAKSGELIEVKKS